MSAYPPGYPSRGTWRFRNATRGFDFTGTLDSIEIVDAHPYDTGTLRVNVVDQTDTLEFQNEDVVWASFAGVRLFRGKVKHRGRTQLSELGTRVYELECQDDTARLDDSIITRKKDRKRETIRRRLRWIHDHLNFNTNLDLSGVPDDEFAEAANYHGMSTLEAFEQVADEHNLFMQLDFDEDGDGTPTLSFFRTITDVASFDLDDHAADFADTFPYQEFKDVDSSDELATMVYVIPADAQESDWVVDETQRALYGWIQASINDSSIKGPAGVARIGGRFLDEFDQPLTEGECVVHQPGLRSGQRINIKNATWGLDYTRYITEVVTTAIDPHDEDDEAYLKSAIKFSDRRKTRRRPARPLEGDIAVPTDPVPVITFPTPTAPPTQSDGDPITLTWAGRMQHSRNHWTLAYSDPAWTSIVGATGAQWLRSHLDGYQSWVSKVGWSSCGGLDNHFGGFTENEYWMRTLMPAIPAGAAGIEFDMPIGNTSGGVQGPSYGSVGAVEIVASPTQPATMRHGTAIGQGFKGQTVTVFVPAELLPAEGSYLYVGYRTGWHTVGVADPYAHACGFSWPFMSDSYELDQDGVEWLGLSGRLTVGATSVTGTWKVWDGTAPDLGTTEQGATIHIAGTIGAPDAWQVDEDGLTVEDDEPAGVGIYVVGGNEDADSPLAAWSDGEGAVRLEFTVTADGSTTDAGTRQLQVIGISHGEKFVGTVHLGDGAYAEGISVAGPSVPVYQEQALTNGQVMVAMFDTRNGQQVRGKMWVKGEGEPTEWAVFGPIEQTEDTQDRLYIWLQAGNDGTTQGLTLHRVETQEGAAPGQHVVGAFIGHASGYEKTFYAPDQFKEGTLKVFVNGKLTPTQSEDGQATTFQLDWWPTPGSSIIVDYIAAGGADT